ncbi:MULTISPECIES: BTAD domain-containing putative transcriptional regulator [unclassified Streptomyces]|uniref:BTAD domain-containing putative transcriptional regulator n=1 Tax=unclassified Streptomyces TaxID=2593676 RepID=UPI000DC7C800|nr:MULTISPECIES: BTAD domain-containing putative transcriptional regulator [unclassified Streptomyces]AWZ08530.1 hypothetical protein DRB89_32520 [Streptomyces sp. ICC4]AWZ15011.1 hypothetical protein DRB96_25205 [Streptomyces sp. ICC1]
MARTSNRTNSAPRPRRSFGDFVKAFLAFVALAFLVVGVPAALATFLGWPLPDELPSVDFFQQQITVQTFLSVLGVVCWLAWAQFTACVLVEVKAAVSGVGMPTRVPGAGGSQALARQLVAALLLVTASAASFAPGLANLGQSPADQHRPAVAASAQQLPGQAQSQTVREAVEQQAAAQAKAAAEHAAEAEGSTKFYRIQPPQGRHHDSLWEIAERHLGDGRRYSEIYDLNKNRVQPDGEKLSKASLIRPGWIMEMPADAFGGDLVETPAAVQETERGAFAGSAAGSGNADIADYAKSGGSGAHAQGGQAKPGGKHAGKPAAGSVDTDTTQIVIPRDWSTAVPSRATPAAPATSQTPATATAVTAADGQGFSFGLPEALLGSPLLAAGLLAALGRRRRAALWQAATRSGSGGAGGAGNTPLVPTGDAADVHDALLVGADPEAVRRLDRALRGLSESLAAASRPLPTVYAAWLTGTAIHLQLAQPYGTPPAPWTHGQDPTFWQLEAGADDHADGGSGGGRDSAGDTAAPYPGLVSLGTLGDSRLLLNLESVPGIVSLSGARADRDAVMASVAAELATNGWSDRMTITLVGFGEELLPLAPSRLRHLADIDDMFQAMEAETRQRAGALGVAGHDSVLTGRTGHIQNTRWAPHLVLMAAEPTEEELDRLAGLASGAGRLGIGYFVAAGAKDVPGAAWEMEITGDGRLLAPLLGLDLEAQQLPADQRAAVVRLFNEADPGSDPAAASGGAQARGAQPFLIDITEAGRPAVYARLVGPYELIGLDTPDGDRSALLHEALALLLLHREGVNPRVLAAALWPRGATDDVRDALVERLRDWLGTDPDGTARLGSDAAGRLTLARSVVSDLDVLRSLHHEAASGRGAGDTAVRERLLTDALGLVRGPLLQDRPAGRYQWLGHEIIEAQLPLLVADVALALSGHHMGLDRPEPAIEALTVAVSSAPEDERLWHGLLRATHATGDEARLSELVARLADRGSAHGRGLAPRTEALIDELLPAWRRGGAAAG